tara:strand:+ start:1588 stop:3048 length:1461 start_codon:yes stop_codon:yes gene_type:complete
MFYIFEMANNHQGSVEHAKKIVDTFASLSEAMNINAGIKLQFRQLDSFVHKSFKDSDLKFVKRFNSTRLSKEEFGEIVEHIRERNLTTIATPFDNESLPWLEDLNVSVVKIASCSIDDWPLLEEVCKINKKIIISTGGASIEHLKKVHDLFKHNERDFAFMHCVGEYPTAIESANLNRITALRKEFPDIQIGFSTHEAPSEPTLAPAARALGCTILEKHVAVPTDTIGINAYSCTVDDMRSVISEVELVEKALFGKPKNEKETLTNLKRGIYLKKNISAGKKISRDDFYYAMPVQEGQFNASSVLALEGRVAINNLKAHDPLTSVDVVTNVDSEKIDHIVEMAKVLLENANVPLSGNESAELSAHYGLNNFAEFGAMIIDKVNREYCKKIIVNLPNQTHPVHHHIKKEEAFELLHGDCTLDLNGKTVQMTKGKPVVIARGVKHSFRTKNGCVIEEISTTHIPGDSIYEDPQINSLKLSDRKIKINF